MQVLSIRHSFHYRGDIGQVFAPAFHQVSLRLRV